MHKDFIQQLIRVDLAYRLYKGRSLPTIINAHAYNTSFFIQANETYEQ